MEPFRLRPAGMAGTGGVAWWTCLLVPEWHGRGVASTASGWWEWRYD